MGILLVACLVVAISDGDTLKARCDAPTGLPVEKKSMGISGTKGELSQPGSEPPKAFENNQSESKRAPLRYELLTVRLAEIDAPENGQAFGQRSKEALSTLCFNTWVTIRPSTLDRYGRTVARVECHGKDASAEQVRHGMAWAFLRYLTDPEIQKIEEGARAARRGLWRDPAPKAPWEWRAARKTPAPQHPE